MAEDEDSSGSEDQHQVSPRTAKREKKIFDDEIIHTCKLIGFGGAKCELTCRLSVKNSTKLLLFFGGDVSDFRHAMLFRASDKEYVEYCLENFRDDLYAKFQGTHAIVVFRPDRHVNSLSEFDHFWTPGTGLVHTLTLLNSLQNDIFDKFQQKWQWDSLKTSIAGFSKGSRVLNHFVAEISTAYLLEELILTPEKRLSPIAPVFVMDWDGPHHRQHPPSWEYVHGISTSRTLVDIMKPHLRTILEFVKRVECWHWIDAHRYPSVELTIRAFCKLVKELSSNNNSNNNNNGIGNSSSVRIFLHATPRQLADSNRKWIREEFDHFQSILKSNGLIPTVHLYYVNEAASFQNHFKIREMSYLPTEILLNIFQRLTNVRDLCNCERVSKQFREIASADIIWSRLCIQDFDLGDLHLTPIDACSSTERTKRYSDSNLHSKYSSFKQMYGAYYLEFGKYLGIFRRAFSVLNRIERFLFNNNGRHILQTLMNGESESKINDFESKSGIQFTPIERIVYRLCGGQAKLADRELNTIAGMFGGYKFYDHVVNLSFLSLEHMKQTSRLISPVVQCVASSISPKNFLIEKATHKIVEIGQNGLVYEVASDLLSLFEQHAFNLESGNFEMSKDLQNGFAEILRYEMKSPNASDCTTRGVRIQAVPIYVPEASASAVRHMVAYHIRITMSNDQNKSQSCQLVTRTWIIDQPGRPTDRVHGPGVIGLFPKVSPGSHFEYESCTNVLGSSAGTMGGSFQMKLDSTGEIFDATVGTFRLVPVTAYCTTQQLIEHFTRNKS